MTKYILSAAVIATITFSGCSQVTDSVSSVAKGTADVAKGATEKVSSAVTNAVDSNKSAATDKVNASVKKVDTKLSSMKVDAPETSLKVGDVVETKIDDASASAASTLPTSSSMTDMATDKAVEVVDEQTDGAATQVIDVIQ